MTEKQVVTVFLYREGRILLVRRSQRVGSYPGRWAGISGYLECEDPVEQVFTELREETGLLPVDVTFLAAGAILDAEDTHLDTRWVVHPYLFRLEHPDKVKLNWENDDTRWFEPSGLEASGTVPRLSEGLKKVLPL